MDNFAARSQFYRMDLVKDAQLVANMIEGDIDAFDELYHRYYKGVLGNILKIVRHHEMAEDILQDVFVALWENRHSLDKDRSVAGWLFIVSRNKSIKQLKRVLKERSFVELGLDGTEPSVPESNPDPVELQMNLLRDAIGQLPARKRQVFQLCGVEGRSHREASEIMGISVSTVQEYMKNSYQIIRRYASKQETTWMLLLMVTFW